jgi:hypothetical protein
LRKLQATYTSGGLVATINNLSGGLVATINNLEKKIFLLYINKKMKEMGNHINNLEYEIFSFYINKKMK